MNETSGKQSLRWLVRGRFRPRTLELFNGRYGRREFSSDIFAGITVGLIALPLALALGVASVPAGVATPFPAPAMGLFTAIIAGFVISLLGGSRVQIGGPTAAFIPIILLIIDKYGFDGLIISTIMAGVILVIMGVARLGTLIKFIPYPVTSGFTTGIAVSIMASQAPDFLGIRADTPAPREFIERMKWIVENIEHANLLSLGLAAGATVLIGFWPKLGLKRIPGSIVAMLLITGVAVAFGFRETFDVATIGSRFGSEAIPHGLPPFNWPDVSLARIRELISPATTIAVLGAIESLLSAVVADGLADDRHDSNTELIAQGVANIVCPFFCGLPATGAIARTSANVNNGGRSPMAGIIHAATLLAIVLVFASFAPHVPLAAIAAVLVMVAIRMGEWNEIARLRLMPIGDAAVLLTTFALTVVFDLVIAVEVGMVLAAVLFIRRVANTTEVSAVTAADELETPEQVMHGKEIPPGVVVYRIFGPFFFGAAEKMEDALLRAEKLPRVLILRMQLVSTMDATALNALESVVERVKKRGGTVILSGPHRQPLEVMRKAGFLEKVGRANIRANFDQALARSREVLGLPAAPTAGT